ncbi:MAG: Clp protease N-terminal domain-containing protein [Acidimicrobiales bacterium]
MFERFTDRARRVLVLAQEEARLLGHSFIGTEHLLLGLVHDGDGIAARTLESLGITLEAVRAKVDETIGPASSATAASPPFTPRAKKVLELSFREALQLGHNYIGTEHILLGLVREGEGVAAQVLQSLGADLPVVREAVISQLSGHEQPFQSSGQRQNRPTTEVDWPRHPIKVIGGPTEALSSEGVTFRIVGVFLYDDGIEVVWRIAGVPKALFELLEDSTITRPNPLFAVPKTIRVPRPGGLVQRRNLKDGGSAIVTSWPGFHRGIPGGNEIKYLKISVDGDLLYVSALGEFELQENGEFAGRSYFVSETFDTEHPLKDAHSLTVEWQGQSIEIDLC